MAKKGKNSLKNTIAILSAILCVAVFALVYVCYGGALPDFTKDQAADTSDCVKVIDVGQGDSILISSNGYTALVDTGPTEGALELAEALKKSNIKTVDVLILSHLHTDHTGGIYRLFEDFTVKNLVLPELSTFSDGINYAQFAIDKVTRAEGQVHTADAGLNFDIGEFELTVLAGYADYSDDNNRSLVIMVKKDNCKMLLTGDIEAKAEKRLLRSGIDFSCDILKVAHHGSKSSSLKTFLAAANPQIAVISCGKDNDYGHPHSETTDRLEAMRIKTYRTDTGGDITLYFEEKIRVETEK